MTHWETHISSDLQVCHGKPCVKGTRVMVSVVLDNLSDGLTAEEIVREYPALQTDDVQAALSYASALAREEEMMPLR